MSKPITLYLIGFSGSGKYTIAKEIAKHGYKVVDNHLINNPIFSLFDLDGITPISEKAWAAIAVIRKSVLNFVSQEQKSNYIFTNELYDVEHEHVIYNQVKQSAESRGSQFIPVKLSLSHQERKKRVTNQERAARFKTTKFSEINMNMRMIQIDHPHLLELDVTDLSAAEAASKILNYIERLM